MEFEPGLQESDSREHPGLGRHDHPPDAQFPGDSDGMDGAAPSEGDQGEVAGVPAPLDRNRLDRPDHAGVGDQVGAIGCDLHIQPQGSGDLLLEHRSGAGDIQLHRSVQQSSRIQIPQQQVGVGDRGLFASLPVAHRTG